MGLKSYIKELKRRNVIKAALAYLVVSWIIIQVASTVLPTFDAPAYITKTIIFIIAIGFPLWLIFSWVYEITPDGIKKTKNIKPEESITPETSNRLNKIIIGALGLAIALLAFNLVSNNQITSKPIKGDDIASVIVSDKSIAVLAFADMSPEQDQEYFSDGISEEILNLLAKTPELKVISRTSSFSYKGKEYDIKKIGQELQVAHVLEGSVRKSGNTFRITAQLINVKDGAHIWSETYDREMSDIFKIQDEIANKVNEKLKISILGKTKETRQINSEAYTLYLKAKLLIRQASSASNNQTEKILKQSIAIDSTYAPAWQLWGQVVFTKAFTYFELPFQEALDKGIELLKHSIDLDPEYAPSYALLSSYYTQGWNFKAAEQNINKAINLDPDNILIAVLAAGNKTYIGKPNEAIRILKAAKIKDPLNPYIDSRLCLYFIFMENYDLAEAALNEYFLLVPNSGYGHNLKGLIHLSRGKFENAIEEFEQDTEAFWKLYYKCMAMFQLDTNKADVLLEQLIKEYGDTAWPNIASVYAYRKENDQAFKWLELTFENKDGSILEILNSPEMKNLWGDPRWNKFIKKLGLPKDHGFHMD